MSEATTTLAVIDRKQTLQSGRFYWKLRRAQDIFFSSLAIIVLSPLMLVTALIIFLDDPHGSPIFAQKRCGRDGKEFNMYKFRSMYVDAEERLAELLQHNEMDGPAFKIKDDPRITRGGHFIRKTSIDELPQLFNIFKGDMSIIGPRPGDVESKNTYQEDEKDKLLIRPGITGYTQAYYRNNLGVREKRLYDACYEHNVTLILDIKILFKTIITVLKRENVYTNDSTEKPSIEEQKEMTEVK